jgi:two-component system, NarL family, response regulator DevR
VTRVFLVDDHEIVRRGIAELVDAEHDLEVVGEAGDVRQGLARIAATLPDVAVLDMRLPDGSGIDLCREIRSRHPEVACLILTAYDDDEAVRSAVLAGAAGYVVKDIRGQALIEDIRRVAAGKRLLPAAAGRRVVASIVAEPAAPADPGLSLRERQVLEFIAEGLTNRQIAERLELAEKTVKNYVSGLLAKLGMESRTQAAVYRATGRRVDPPR